MTSNQKTSDSRYWTYNDNHKLPVMIMLHGLRGTHHGLDLIAKEIQGFRIIVPDLPGFGESEPLQDEHSINNYVKWLRGFIRDLNLNEKPFLLGHSFGSIIASHYASQYPSTISKMILVNPIGAPALKGPRAIMSKLAIVYYWFSRILPESWGRRLLSSKFIIRIISNSMAKTNDKALRNFIHDQHYLYFSTFKNNKVVEEAFRASVSNNVRDVAEKIEVPTLLIAGEIDDITPLNKQKDLVNIFPSAKLTVLNGVGHLTHYETPKAVAKEIVSFLN